ncbi:MAG: arginine transporter [Yoonia sp.]|nr:arginine transporter [Yoonia sp.]
MRKLILLGALVFLAACGGNRVSGDISKACIAADRKAASTRLCSCVQQAANQTLSRSDQRRAATFFEEPHLAQETRQSDNSGSERFWQRYKKFSATAKRMCG